MEAYSRLEPVHKLDNVRVLQALEHVQLVKDHLLIPPDHLLQDDLDRDATLGAVCLSDDAVCAGAERAPKPVLGSVLGSVSAVFST